MSRLGYEVDDVCLTVRLKEGAKVYGRYALSHQQKDRGCYSLKAGGTRHVLHQVV
jgi:hypothetical protein